MTAIWQLCVEEIVVVITRLLFDSSSTDTLSRVESWHASPRHARPACNNRMDRAPAECVLNGSACLLGVVHMCLPLVPAEQAHR